MMAGDAYTLFSSYTHTHTHTHAHTHHTDAIELQLIATVPKPSSSASSCGNGGAACPFLLLLQTPLSGFEQPQEIHHPATLLWELAARHDITLCYMYVYVRDWVGLSWLCVCC